MQADAVARIADVTAWLAMGVKLIKCAQEGMCQDGSWAKKMQKKAFKLIQRVEKYHGYIKQAEDAIRSTARHLFGNLNELQTPGYVHSETPPTMVMCLIMTG